MVKHERLTCLFSVSYQELMKESSRMPLFDLKKLNSSLPVPSVQKSSIEVLVLGAKNDFIVVMLCLFTSSLFFMATYGIGPLCIFDNPLSLSRKHRSEY